MLNAPKWATNSGLTGEIGISSMSSRITQGRICYINNRKKEGNNLIKLVINELEANNGRWKTYSKKQYAKIGAYQNEAYHKSKREVKDCIHTTANFRYDIK